MIGPATLRGSDPIESGAAHAIAIAGASINYTADEGF